MIKNKFFSFFSTENLIYKKIRNRIPEKAVNGCRKYLFPYSSIALICVFSLMINLTHAAESSAVFISSEEVMDLSPVEVANVVSVLNPYTKNYEEDPVQVALAMKDTDYVGKPIIVETAQIPVETQPEKKEETRKSTITYSVEGGDTLSSIGWKYGLKIATIKATNNLTSETLKPGQKLKLPASDLSTAQIKAAQDKAKKKTVAGTSTKKVSTKAGSSVNGYPWGWCTYYVATRRYVPARWGNASSWLSSAQRSGYSTGKDPVAGAIVVTAESKWGHVAYVESVNGNTITISEMNARGWGVTSSRTISAHGGVVRGYIY